MNTARKLTKKFVESITPHEINELLLWDTELKGFGIRIFPTGRRTYFVQYRNQYGHTRRKKIGVHGTITAELAREEAKKILGDVAKGRDPSKEAQKARTNPTLQDLATEYLDIHARGKKRLKSYKEDQRMLIRVILPRLGEKKVEELTPLDLQYLHSHLKNTPYVANRVMALLHKMFNLAVQWKWVKSNPATGIKKYKEYKRDRWLKDEEMEKLWNVLDQYPGHVTAYAFKFLLITGARKGEVLNATWDQFDLENGVWSKPSHLTKQDKKEHLPISSKALELLEEIKKFKKPDSLYLFPGRMPGQPLKEPKTLWRTVLKKAGIENFRIHDLRHTHASHLVSSGLSLSIVGKLLGHTQAATTQRYAHLADEPLRQAVELFSSKIKRERNK
jgi:integrase